MPRKKAEAQTITQPNNYWLSILLTIIFFFIVGAVIHKNLYHGDVKPSIEAPVNNIQTELPAITDSKQTDPKPTPLPNKFSLVVPFTPQAPTANWDELHNEACEEASSIIVNSFFEGLTTLPPKLVEEEISKLTNWQTKNYGYSLSIDTEETAHMMEQVYGLKTEVVDISEEAIKQALLDNKLIIYAANGKLLKNPYFKPPGPIYHMLVITGWDEDKFITNDPGTKRGLNYQYTYDTLYNASGNWSHSLHQVDLGDKKIIIVTK